MNKDVLFKVLQLDSIFEVLDWAERVAIHIYIAGKEKRTTSKIFDIYEWIITNNWQSPTMKYGDDRLQYFLKNEIWEPLENYKRYNPEIEKALNQLK